MGRIGKRIPYLEGEFCILRENSVSGGRILYLEGEFCILRENFVYLGGESVAGGRIL